jgi:hypothetical protein
LTGGRLPGALSIGRIGNRSWPGFAECRRWDARAGKDREVVVDQDDDAGADKRSGDCADHGCRRPRAALRLSGDGDQDFLGAVNGSCAAAFALVLLGVGFAALGFGAAREAKAGIVEAGELALHGFGDAFGGDRGVNVREVISAQLRARLRWRDGASDRANPAKRSLLCPGSPVPGFALPLPACRCERAGRAHSAARCMGAAAE